ncbi:MAG: endonuclease MutS2 [Oscillospiraceae bacterium]|nr:endonuclease MutS2 [Oscillospiraceae bacterium]
MNTQLSPDYITLELHKVLEALSREAANEKTKELALALTPETDAERVRHLLQQTEDAFQLSVRFGAPGFDSFRDVCAAIRHTQSGARISLKELLEIARLLRQISSLSDWYAHCEQMQTTLSDLFERLRPNPYLADLLERSIETEERLADAASPALGQIRRKLAQAGARLREKLEKMIKSPSMQTYLQEQIVTIRDGRYVIPVKAEHRGDVAGLIHDTSATGQTYFIEPMAIVEANNDIRLLETQELEETDRIMQRLCAACGEAAEDMLSGYQIAAELNLYFAKASLGAMQKGVIPQIHEDGTILLKKARHPLLDPKTVVPISLSLGTDYHALIITGPNTGGKTVALKTVGLLTAMAMCGLMIPAADGSCISVFDRILVDIGDRQSIEYNLSTFSAHTLQDIAILQNADDRTLVLIDELGSGTDPVEGAALAVAVIERLRQQGAVMIVTTHYQELKRYALETPDVENASCEFDLETLKPTYKLVIGSPGKSNAFAIAGSLGMPEDVIAHARQLVSTENQRFEQAVEQLDRARAEHEKELAELTRLRTDAAAHEKALREQAETMERRREEEISRIKEQARRIVEQTVSESNALLEELRALKKEKDSADFAQKIAAAKTDTRQAVDRLYANTDRDDQSTYSLPRALVPGDSVLIVSMGRSGTVLAEPSGSMVTVQIGAMKTRVPLDQVRLEVQKTNQKAQQQKQKVHTTVVRSEKGKSGSVRGGANELDIRGCTVDEGIMMTEQFISGSVLMGFETVTIIHGKGTGALRKGIHEHLRRMKQVKSFRLGVYGEGEDGVTVVKLK